MRDNQNKFVRAIYSAQFLRATLPSVISQWYHVSLSSITSVDTYIPKIKNTSTVEAKKV